MLQENRTDQKCVCPVTRDMKDQKGTLGATDLNKGWKAFKTSFKWKLNGTLSCQNITTYLLKLIEQKIHFRILLKTHHFRQVDLTDYPLSADFTLWFITSFMHRTVLC